MILNKTKYWNETLGCHTQYKGLLKLWGSIDIYLQSVDELLCSYYCPCYLNRTSTMKFLTNINTAPYYNLWHISNSTLLVTKFQKCNDVIYYKAYNNYLMRNSFYNYKLNQKKFEKYYSYIEKYFKCTGFCSLNYFNENTKTNSKIVKYLFSDISEIPNNFGCLEKILNWFKINLYIFVSIFLCLFLFQLILLILVIITFDTKEKKQIPNIRNEIIISELNDNVNGINVKNIRIPHQNSNTFNNNKSTNSNNNYTNLNKTNEVNFFKKESKVNENSKNNKN